MSRLLDDRKKNFFTSKHVLRHEKNVESNIRNSNYSIKFRKKIFFSKTIANICFGVEYFKN